MASCGAGRLSDFYLSFAGQGNETRDGASDISTQDRVPLVSSAAGLTHSVAEAMQANRWRPFELWAFGPPIDMKM